MNENEKINENLANMVAQKESERRLKIKSIQNTITDANNKKRKAAIAFGIFAAGVLASVHFSGVDAEQAINLEIQALNSFDALKEYLATCTPAIYGTIAATVVSVSTYIKNRKIEKNAKRKLENMVSTNPEEIKQSMDYANLLANLRKEIDEVKKEMNLTPEKEEKIRQERQEEERQVQQEVQKVVNEIEKQAQMKEYGFTIKPQEKDKVSQQMINDYEKLLEKQENDIEITQGKSR